MKRPLSFFLALSSLLASAPAFSDDIYKGLDEHGRTVYSNNPRSLRNPQKLNLEAPPTISGSPSPSGPADAPGDAPSRSEAPAVNRERSSEGPAESPAPSSSDEVAQRQAIERAQAELAAAQRAKAEGGEPQEGERLGSVAPGAARSRLAPSYFERQERLDREVQEAQDRLNELLRTR